LGCNIYTYWKMKTRKPLQIIRFKLEQRKDKQTGIVKTENVPIIIDFKFEGNRAKYPIGYRIDCDKWNPESQRVKNNNFNKDKITAGTINKRIERISEQLPKIYDEAVKLDKIITTKYLWSELEKKIRELENTTDNSAEVKKQPTVTEYMQIFIDTESKAKDWSGAIVTKFGTLKAHLTDYCEKHNCILHFPDITGDFLQSLIEYLRTEKKLNNNTNKKYLKMLTWFMNWASKPKEKNENKPYNTNLAYKTFEYKFKGTATADQQKNIIFLSWNELQHFINFNFSYSKRLEQVRDIYCFCCLTSLRFSDIQHLKKSNFKTDDSGNHFIEVTTIKTDDKLKIELNKYALAIWEKYKGIDLKNDRAFPVPSNQKFNLYLKEAGEKAEFNSVETYIEYKGNKRIETNYKKYELLTHHTARKTFIINALSLNIQPDVIMKWTGHKDHKTMAVYTKIVDEQKQLSMNKFNEI
jgi:integrase